MPRYLPAVRAGAPPLLQPLLAPISYPVFLCALGLVSTLSLAIAAWASARPQARWAHWAAALVQAVVALNVLSHLGTAFVLGGYVPGLGTAVFANLPFSIYFFRRVARSRWLPSRALWATIPAAVVVHGPGLLGVFWLAQWLAPALGASHSSRPGAG